MRVLLADDDAHIRRALDITLRAHGYEVIAVGDGASAVRAVASARPDAAIIDLGMPGMDGLEVIEALRGTSSIPVLVVSGRTDSREKVRALDLGADDYVTKPFSTDELLARLRALARRQRPAAEAPTEVRLGAVRIDRAATAVENTETGASIHLTPTEWKILNVLLDAPGRLVTRDLIFEAIWGTAQTVDTGYLRLYMSQLRKKLEKDPRHPRHLLTEAGMGYRLVLDEE